MSIPEENLAIWRQAALENRELRLLQVEELAKQAARDFPTGEEFDPMQFAAHLPHRHTPRGEDATFLSLTDLDEQLAFCRALLRERPELVRSAQGITAPAPEHPRVARLSGPIFDRALSALSPLLPHARSLHLPSLAEVMAETAAGNADFALLPIEDTKGNRLLHFYEECDKLDLHITHTCAVSTDEGEMRFALLSQLYRPACHLPATRLISCRVAERDGKTLPLLLCAASTVGLTLRRVDAIPAPDREDGFLHHAVFECRRGQADLLPLYLSLFLPHATLTGNYLHIK